MNQYEVIYNDKSIEHIDAYGYKRHAGRVVFDLGGGRTLTVSNVKAVRLLAVG